MTENRPFTSLIAESISKLTTGKVKFVEQQNNWTIKVKGSWDKKWLLIAVESCKIDLKSHFSPCKLKQAPLLSFLKRSSAFNFYGEKSKYSELLLESPETKHLMSSKKSCIKLDNNTLIFGGMIRKKDTKSLSNIFTLIEDLQGKIDNLERTTSA